MVDVQDTMLAPIKQVVTEPEGLMQEELSRFINALKVIREDRASDQGKTREEHTKMYVPTLLKTKPGSDGRTSIMLALPDSGNLLAHAAIDAEFHEKLGTLTEATKIRARAANKQALEIQGVLRGIYLRFPNIAKTFFVKPLVVLQPEPGHTI